MLVKLYNAILNQDIDAATHAAKECVESKVDIEQAIAKASEAMTEVGALFDRGEMFLPQMVVSADAMKSAANILFEKLPTKPSKLGKFLIGTVEGDVHDVGKGIVSVMLDAAGFEVIDIGRDVPLKVFIEKTREFSPDIVGCSALLTVTRVGQRDVIEQLKKAGLREKVKVMVGGGATTGVWAEEIGADAWGEDGPDAVRKAKELIRV